MVTNANYANRSVDIAIYHGIKERGMVTVDQNLFDNGGEVCTGIQKLIQRWLLTFLTPLGTVHFHPERGTSFIAEAPYFHNEAEARSTFFLCNSDAMDQIKSEETDDMAKDERMDHVELISLIPEETGFQLSVKVYSQYGTASPVTLPITVNPLQL